MQKLHQVFLHPRVSFLGELMVVQYITASIPLFLLIEVRYTLLSLILHMRTRRERREHVCTLLTLRASVPLFLLIKVR